MKLYGSLDNYIEMHRQRAGLSQAELSFLVEVEDRGSIARFEQGQRLPNLETALALECVFGEDLPDVFAGVAERIRERVTNRARILLERIDDRRLDGLAAKLELLSKLARPDDVSIIPLWEDAA